MLLCGHTHVPRAVRLRDGRLIVNPGSVGLQINHGSPDARYAIVELRGGKYYPSFHAVPYDHFAAARQAEANGFPQWRDALVTGWVGTAWAVLALNRSRELSDCDTKFMGASAAWLRRS